MARTGPAVKTGVYETWHWRGKRHTSTFQGVLLDAQDSLVGWCGKGQEHDHRSRGEALACAEQALTAHLQRTQGRR